MKYLLIYNPISGKGKFKKKIPYIKKTFEEQMLHLDIYESNGNSDLVQKAFEEAPNYEVFLVSGGDGTINQVVNGIMKSNRRPAIAVLPFGTANDIAAILGIPKKLKKALDIVFTRTPIYMDINKINNDYFVYTAATGILTKVSYDISRRHLKKYGYLAYVFAGVKDLMHDYRFPLKIKANGEAIQNEYMLALGLCSNRVGGMHLKKFATSKLNDGMFEMRFFERKRKFRVFRLLSFFLRRGKRLKEDLHLSSNNFEIEASDRVTWNTDGELSQCGNVRIMTLKQEILVFASDKAKKRYF